jgi:UDP-N-acetylglucosamine acyltransferase
MSRIHPSAIVDPSVRLGADVEIGPFCIIGDSVEIGDRTRLVAHVTIERRTSLGADNVVHANAVLGGAPQIAHYADCATDLVIGDRNVIREGVTFHRGASTGKGVTRIGSDGMFMVGAHVAHDCIVGDSVVFANCAALGGHAEIGDGAFLGGLCAVHQFTRVGRWAMIGGLTPVTADVIPFARAAGNPGRLAGLNTIGLKRRGLANDRVRALTRAYSHIFNGPGTFAERIAGARDAIEITPEVDELIGFIATGETRELCHPPKRR